MKSYGLAALAPLAIINTSSRTDAPSATGGWGRGKKAITTANLQMELAEFDYFQKPAQMGCITSPNFYSLQVSSMVA